MSTLILGLIVNIILGATLLYFIIYPRVSQWYKKRKTERERIRKQALTKAIRREVRAFLEELQK